MATENPADRLREIQKEMIDLLHEAENIIRRSKNKMAWERARSYWLAEVKMGLTDDHEYVGSAGVSMDDTIDELDTKRESEEGCEEEAIECDE